MGAQKALPSNSGQDNTDIINNIYDLGSNLYEFTQEANNTKNRVLRGGSYDASKKILLQPVLYIVLISLPNQKFLWYSNIYFF